MPKKNNLKYIRNWQANHKANVEQARRKWAEAHPDYPKKHRLINKKYYKEYHKKWQHDNADKIRADHAKYVSAKRNSDPNVKLQKILRDRLRNALKGNFKSGSAVSDLGCSIPQLKSYLESLFQQGMTWANHGKLWHIDHIIPLSKFNLQERTQFLIACNYKNLQPLWKDDNFTKHNFHILDFRNGLF
jgi:hypothetical protein